MPEEDASAYKELEGALVVTLHRQEGAHTSPRAMTRSRRCAARCAVLQARSCSALFRAARLAAATC